MSKRTKLNLHDEQIALIIEHLEIDFNFFYGQKSDGNNHFHDIKWVVNDLKNQMPNKFFSSHFNIQGTIRPLSIDTAIPILTLSC